MRGSLAPLFVGAIAALAFVVFVATRPTASPEPAPAPQPTAEANAAQAHMTLCRNLTDVDGNTLDWERATQECQAVLDVDPINAEARKLKKLAIQETGQKKIYERGHALFLAGHQQEAIDAYLSLDADTHFIALAHHEFKLASVVLQKRHGEVCLQALAAHEVDKAWAACKAYEDYACYLGNEAKYQDAFDALQKQFNGKDNWSCPRQYKRWIERGCSLGTLATPRTKAISAKYPDPVLASAIIEYSLDPVQGRASLVKYIDAEHGLADTLAPKLLTAEIAFYAAHEAAYQNMLKGDLDGAGAQVRVAQKFDGQVMPAPFESVMMEQDLDALGNKYAEEGKQALGSRKFASAYGSCAKGWAFTKSNLNVSSCLADLEAEAAGLDTSKCKDVALILKITRPESLLHRRGAEALHRQHCP